MTAGCDYYCLKNLTKAILFSEKTSESYRRRKSGVKCVTERVEMTNLDMWGKRISDFDPSRQRQRHFGGICDFRGEKTHTRWAVYAHSCLLVTPP